MTSHKISYIYFLVVVAALASVTASGSVHCQNEEHLINQCLKFISEESEENLATDTQVLNTEKESFVAFEQPYNYQLDFLHTPLPIALHIDIRKVVACKNQILRE